MSLFNVMRVLRVASVFAVLALPSLADDREFEIGQLWECTDYPERDDVIEPIQFFVSGITTNREVSRRPNFQNDNLVVSVYAVALDQELCSRARSVPHMAFTEPALRSCSPSLLHQVENPESFPEWNAARDTRGLWITQMQLGTGAVFDLDPSSSFALLRRSRCQ